MAMTVPESSPGPFILQRPHHLTHEAQRMERTDIRTWRIRILDAQTAEQLDAIAAALHEQFPDDMAAGELAESVLMVRHALESRARQMTDQDATRYRERFDDAETAAELHELARELMTKHRGDVFAQTLASEIAMALVSMGEDLG